MTYKKGQSGNPFGRKKGSKNTFTINELKKSIKKVEGKSKINIFEHFVKRAFISDSVLIALMKKIIPNPQPESPSDEHWLDELELVLIPPNPSKTEIEKYKKYLS